MKCKYTLIIDDVIVKASNSIKTLKAEADYYFKYLQAFDAQIVNGNMLYCIKNCNNTKWFRLSRKIDMNKYKTI